MARISQKETFLQCNIYFKQDDQSTIECYSCLALIFVDYVSFFSRNAFTSLNSNAVFSGLDSVISL
jgi:hypothetical protein